MTASASEDAAFALVEAGRLAEAEKAWREILERKPDDPDALHLLGYILAVTGRTDEGLALLDRAIEAAPRAAAIRSNRATVLNGLGRNEEALRDVRRALDLDPRLPAALHLLGTIRFSEGRIDEAAAAYRRALAVDPRMHQAHLGMGWVHFERGDRAGAQQSYEAALAAEPRNAAAHFNLGVLWESGGDLARAEASYRRALELDPGDFMALNNLGVVLRLAGREVEARASLDSALARAPGHPDVLNNVGLSLQRSGRADEAIDAYVRAVAARPGFARALVNWGNALQDKGELETARERYVEARRASPGLAEARYGEAQVALRQQRFEPGWDDYESRFETAPPFSSPRALSLPRLTLENLADAKRVAVWSEQGLGDQVLYSTLLTELERCGTSAVVEVDPRLMPAYRRRFPEMTFIPPGSDPGFRGCDCQIPIASLPRMFRRSLASFAAQPRSLLAPDPGRESAMRAQLGPGRWIGIGWRSLQSGERREMAERKSIPLEHFGRLSQVAGVRLLDLQYGEVRNERESFNTRHPGALRRLEGLDAFNDLEGVIAAIAACERVITSSNVIAHLAGALGKPTWLVYLRAREPFYYWVAGPDGRSLWYPAVEIVTDSAWTEWEQAFESVAARLAAA